MQIYYKKYAPYVYSYLSAVGKTLLNAYNWMLFKTTGYRNLREANEALIKKFERFVVKRASKFAYRDSQSKGQGIRQGIVKRNQGIWDYLD